MFCKYIYCLYFRDNRLLPILSCRGSQWRLLRKPARCEFSWRAFFIYRARSVQAKSTSRWRLRRGRLAALWSWWRVGIQRRPGYSSCWCGIDTNWFWQHEMVESLRFLLGNNCSLIIRFSRYQRSYFLPANIVELFNFYRKSFFFPPKNMISLLLFF